MRTNVNFDRERFLSVTEWCNKNGVVPQVSKLRVSQPLVAGIGDYDFDLKTKTGISGEVVLDRNDVFIPFGVGIGIAIDTNTPAGKAPLYSYAPRAGVQNAFGFMTADIEALYNGSLTIQADQLMINQSYPCEVFKYVPQTQPAITVNSSDAEVSLGLQPEYDADKLICPLVPNYIYQGTMDLKTTVHFNGVASDFSVATAATPTQADTDHTARLVYLMIGVLVKNMADSPKLYELKNALNS